MERDNFIFNIFVNVLNIVCTNDMKQSCLYQVTNPVVNCL